jgi:hypothetical protein
VALAKGREATRLPLTSSGVQRAAARLVATCALLGALAATRGIPDVADRPLRHPPAAQLTIGDHAGPGQTWSPTAPPGDSRQQGATGAPERSADPSPVYEVQRRDTLWRIAECHLGNPLRWREIYELNRGLPQADGRTLTDPDVITPGWTLRLPADATDLPTTAPAPSTSRPPPGTQPPGTDDRTGVGAAPSGWDERSGAPTAGRPDGSSGDGMVLVDDDLVPADASPSGRSADDVVAAGDAAQPSPPAPPIPPTSPASPDTADGMVLLPDDLVTGDGARTTDDDWMVARGDDRRR